MQEIVALSWSMAFCEAVVPAALESLVGYWSHSCLFGRPAFAVLQEAYATARSSSCVPVALPGAVRNELLVPACFAPLLATDPRALVSSTILATDAATGVHGSSA